MRKYLWLELVFVVAVVAGTVSFLRKPDTSQQASTPLGVASPIASSPDASSSAISAPAASTTGGGMVMEQTDFYAADGRPGYQQVRSLVWPPTSAEAVKRGQELYSANCASCHGSDLDGRGPAAAALKPSPTDLVDVDSYNYGFQEHGLYRSTVYGIEDTGMAPFEGILTPAQSWDIVHFIRSRQAKPKRPQPPMR